MNINSFIVAECASLVFGLSNLHQVVRERFQIGSTSVYDFSGVIPTTTGEFGYTTEESGVFGKAFLNFITSLGDGRGVVADVGVGWTGVNTLPLVMRRHTVFAVDTLADELKALAWRSKSAMEKSQDEFLRMHWRKHLLLLQHSLPKPLPFDSNSLDGVMLGSVLHFLKGDEVENVLREVYRVLRPGGRVFIEAQTPYMDGLDEWRNSIQADVLESPWPWQLRNKNGKNPILGRVRYINLFDLRILERSLRNAGFTVGEVGYFARAAYPDRKSRHAGNTRLRRRYTEISTPDMEFESVGGIGTKPVPEGWVGECRPSRYIDAARRESQ